jgi:retron-type reverse transcriptase
MNCFPEKLTKSDACWADGGGAMFEKLVSFKNLLRAYRLCLRRKRNTIAAREIEPIYESVLWKLKRELEREIWRPKPYRAFAVTEPCLREIFAADFSDRIVHHALYEIINPLFEARFIGQSYACRDNKGTHRAVKDLRKALRASGGREVWVLKMDIESFFMSIDRALLLEIIGKTVKDGAVLRLIETIIYADPVKDAVKTGNAALLERVPFHKSLFGAPPGLGLPIGNLTSQLFANVYLNELDQFVKKVLRVKCYFRYVDDFIIADCSPKRLTVFQKRISGFLKNRLRLKLHEKKTFIAPAKRGIDFLGYFIKPDYVLVRRKVVFRMKSKLREFERQKEPNAAKKFLPVMNSYFGHFKHANSYRLRKSVFEKLPGGLKHCLAPRSDFSSPRPAVVCLPNSAGLC